MNIVVNITSWAGISGGAEFKLLSERISDITRKI